MQTQIELYRLEQKLKHEKIKKEEEKKKREIYLLSKIGSLIELNKEIRASIIIVRSIKKFYLKIPLNKNYLNIPPIYRFRFKITEMNKIEPSKMRTEDLDLEIALRASLKEQEKFETDPK